MTVEQQPVSGAEGTGSAASLLAVHGLSVEFRGAEGIHRVVDDVSFSVARGETLAIVGESGSGKSVSSLAVMGLIKAPAGRIAAGTALLDGIDLTALPSKSLRRLRGDRMAMVFQEPMTSLNPAFRVGEQIAESVRHHRGWSRKAATNRAVEVLETVGIPNARSRVRSFPHEFSGGMRQRVMIALAIACEPDLLIADEPTTALDVTVQSQVLDLLMKMKDALGMGLLLVTHDFGVVADTADRVAVMYAGQVVEQGDVFRIFERPRHPYTAALLQAMPQRSRRDEPLWTIPGAPPPPGALLEGCRFAPRCAFATEACRSAPVSWTSLPDGGVRCVRADELVLEVGT